MVCATSTFVHMPVGVLLAAIVFGAGILAFGVAAYRGHNKYQVLMRTSFTVPFELGETHPFAAAWGGAAFLLLAVIDGVQRLGRVGEVIAVLLIFAAVGCLLIGVMALRWLPDFLLPAWFKDWRARGRPVEEMGKAPWQ